MSNSTSELLGICINFCENSIIELFTSKFCFLVNYDFLDLIEHKYSCWRRYTCSVSAVIKMIIFTVSPQELPAGVSEGKGADTCKISLFPLTEISNEFMSIFFWETKWIFTSHWDLIVNVWKNVELNKNNEPMNTLIPSFHAIYEFHGGYIWTIAYGIIFLYVQYIGHA